MHFSRLRGALCGVDYVCLQWTGTSTSATSIHHRRVPPRFGCVVFRHTQHCTCVQLKNYRDLVVYLPPSYDENPFKVCARRLALHARRARPIVNPVLRAGTQTYDDVLIMVRRRGVRVLACSCACLCLRVCVYMRT
jgi:hypothetical protein